ncbi:MAG: hypothetical protein HQL28_06460 [Candidatus Omnitrophica bacterium]|nr:hypothetical protein [Candidatus Omnitrophota bacterium]
MAYTLPFVIYGIFRYLYVVNTRGIGGDPGEVLLSDAPSLVNLVLWGAAVVAVLYH